MKYFSILAIFAAILFISCGAEESQSGEADTDSVKDEAITELRGMEKEIMKIHDEVMPSMSGLNNMTKKLEGLATEETDEATLAEINSAISSLNAADSLMWDWMHNYKRPDYEGDLAPAREYLENELKRVNVMKEAMVSSMIEGGLMLDKMNSNED